MTTSNLNIRIDDDLKQQAKVILYGYGISPSQAVKMLFLELVATRKFPFQKTHPNLPKGKFSVFFLLHRLLPL